MHAFAWAVEYYDGVDVPRVLVGTRDGDAVWQVTLLEVAHASPFTREPRIEEVRQLVRLEVLGLFVGSLG